MVLRKDCPPRAICLGGRSWSSIGSVKAVYSWRVVVAAKNQTPESLREAEALALETDADLARKLGPPIEANGRTRDGA